MNNKRFTIIILVFLCHVATSQNHWFVDSIPMRDGKKLSADIYLPDTTGGQSFPVILVQTPYNRLYYRLALPLGFGTQNQNAPFAFVIVDWRCFYGSASACVVNADRGEDGYDVVEWIASQSWSNHKIGTWGPSALGRIQYQTAKEKPPHLTCAVPLVAGPQYNYQEYYQGGVLRKEYVETLDALGFGLSTTLLAHQVFDIFWQYSENSTFYTSQIEVPLLMIGGWYDHNTNVMFDFFKGLKQSAPLSVREKHKLLMGPWAHGGFGTAQVGTGQQGQLFYPEAARWSDSLALLFFDFYLRNENNGWDSLTDYTYFQMGENIWNFTDVFPPQSASSHLFYFNTDLTLSDSPPSNLNDSVMFNYDPKNPSPTVGGATLTQSLGQGPYDQAPVVEARNDISVFTSPLITTPIVLKGKPNVVLNVSSNVLDTDFNVRLTDVYPDGRSMLIVEGVKRMRFRSGYWAADTAAMLPGNIYQITIELPYLAHSFLVGHKIRVDVSSSNYPRFALNLNNGGAMYVAGDSLMAQNIIYTNSNYSSYINLPLVGYISAVNDPSDLQSESLMIYPNPVEDYLNVEIKNTIIQHNYKIEIFDVFGRVCLKNINFFKIPCTSLKSGLYLIKLTDEKGRICAKKFIKK